MIKSLYSILDEVDKAENNQKRKELLKRYETNPLFKSFIIHMYDPDLKNKWVVDKNITYKPYPEAMAEGMLWSYVKKFYIYIEGGYPGIKPEVRNKKFIQMLETLNEDDAKMMHFFIKNRRMPFKNITTPLLRETFEFAKDWKFDKYVNTKYKDENKEENLEE